MNAYPWGMFLAQADAQDIEPEEQEPREEWFDFYSDRVNTVLAHFMGSERFGYEFTLEMDTENFTWWISDRPRKPHDATAICFSNLGECWDWNKELKDGVSASLSRMSRECALAWGEYFQVDLRAEHLGLSREEREEYGSEAWGKAYRLMP